MNAIHQLDTFLSNKIAAGEVVERPASVVKELVENAVDAGSAQIRIDTAEGGLAKIRVLDDGGGITSEDIALAFSRHATSKIFADEDLFRIKTLGFRGEALPSIASVAKVTLRTSTGEKDGEEVFIEGGEIRERKTAALRRGTEITVTDLFYNTPARLKYLKTVHTELGHISDAVNRIALAHPEIAFTLTHNEKTLLQTAGNGDIARVIAAIYGTSIGRKLLNIEAEDLDFQVTGYIAKPEVTRANRNYMTTIINGRFVKNYALYKAVQDGFHTLLPIGKFPLVVLHIEMNPLLVDVNVHPSKLEVRISKEKALQDLVKKAIQERLQKERLIPEAETPHPVHGEGEKPLRTEQLNLTSNQPAPFSEPIKDPPLEHVNRGDAAGETVHEEQEHLHASSASEPLDQGGDNEDRQADNIAKPPAEPPSSKVPELEPIGQLHSTYIVAENETGLYLIDQHAAQERIKYEEFREKLASAAKETQELLVPLTIECTTSEEMQIEQSRSWLEDVGLELEPFGKGTYIVRACPTWFPQGEEEAIIFEMIEHLKQLDHIHIGKIREEAAIMMSCKAAIKANHFLRKEDMRYLLDDLRACTEPYTCPHGRPIIVHYSVGEIERMFKRIQ
ncbi:DNA mismatch repair endonuclease MutL [Salisediminibacterium halotolerans]|uniref:DNA mismatch repair protein MutL n=1 Tax=Salisediminibacterium halotolerans TaxID=517425 RepID=A0A1H9W6S1_9BACI|nr:DNA mismatch repair endonuclease MutL [Salisediminibacterium haloalkalitolerans]SES29479.1 DNA mismatch repair protein MutL [Salisediminibacterium haloalkalitolerans]